MSWSLESPKEDDHLLDKLLGKPRLVYESTRPLKQTRPMCDSGRRYASNPFEDDGGEDGLRGL